MAWKEGTVQPQHFVEEIDYTEIEKLEVVGKGSFGVVWRGRWRETYVAVKDIDSEAEKKAFAVEVRQLSRVSHPNIVKLYGACTKNPVCLVMEYAEGGSLYNVLHNTPLPIYTAGHAMSWALQCAKGVAYLHNMKPKALIHRDLKPPNLLLIMGGKVLKICDFGTACDKKTYMTNNKGSAAWMAPEVFEGSNYTEKCDVFSWGIILWEVLSRRKPFDDIGGSAFRIMWAVHTGERPPLISGCPKPIEQLMTSCWDKNPASRPSMDEVVHIMSQLLPFFSGYEEPVQYPSEVSAPVSEESDNTEEDNSGSDTLDSQLELRSTFGDESQIQVAPSALNGSLGAGTTVTREEQERLSTPLHIHVDPDAWTLEGDAWQQNGSGLENTLSTSSGPVHMEIRNRPGLDRMVVTSNSPQHHMQDRLQEQPDQFQAPAGTGGSTHHEELDNVYLMLDPQLHPITPNTSCQQSVQIFEQHKQLAQDYLKVQTEIAYLSRHKAQLAERLSEAEGLSQLDQQDSERHQEELRKLENEKESLLALHRNLKRQLDIINRQRRNNVGGDGWVVVSNQNHSHVP
ncbi:mitogen-activated protein kinase kinase kinase 7 isoform X2 [Cryptotermes secundus]|uniref:mitogen-activated protein kinase kinase kinase 7 isoform X2 n=1 Tax=Cryptotermes secundus TaxID=105785 RepID=UPI000CD7AF2F|nr:mitogen-activated protein kinase kinase kinase 7 isoform X2 [Cryptotermes secundus]